MLEHRNTLLDLHTFIPAFFYPTHIYFVDDNDTFLKKLPLLLDDGLLYKSFNSASQVLECIEKPGVKAASDVSAFFVSDEESSSTPFGKSKININLSTLAQQILNTERFNEVSVLVVDYSMPGMNGIELCQHLSKHPGKKIMLTGQADQHIAIKAFNEGLIDKFILKSDPDAISYLNQSIVELQLEYFKAKTQSLLAAISAESGFSLRDASFIKMFKRICEQNSIVEFYLIESSGSFLMRDKEGRPTWLIVRTAKDLEMYYEVAREDKAPEKVLSQIKSCQAIPFFANSNDFYSVTADSWEKYLYPAKTVRGNIDYNYFTISHLPHYPLEFRQEDNYQSHLNKAWAS